MVVLLRSEYNVLPLTFRQVFYNLLVTVQIQLTCCYFNLQFNFTHSHLSRLHLMSASNLYVSHQLLRFIKTQLQFKLETFKMMP